MLGVVTQHVRRPGRAGDAPDGGRPGRRATRSAACRSGCSCPTPTVRAGQTVARPVLRRPRARRGPRATAAATAWWAAGRGAKNTLVKNYLHLAERAGARVEPLRTVTRVRAAAPGTARTRGGASPRSGPGSPGVPRAASAAVRTRDLPGRGPGGRERGARSPCCCGCGPRGSCPTCRTRARHPDPDQLRGAGRAPTADRVPGQVDLTRGLAITSSFHPDAGHPRGELPLRAGLGRHGAAGHAARRRGWAVAAPAALRRPRPSATRWASVRSLSGARAGADVR